MRITSHEGMSSFTGWAGLELCFEENHPENEPRASVVLLHGYAEHTGWLRPVSDSLLKAGFSAYAFDLRGHGRSEGVRGDLVKFRDLSRDITTFIEYVCERSGGRKVFIVAHSLGASAAVYYASTGQARIDGLVTSGIYVKDAGEYAKWKHSAGRMLAPFLPLVPIQKLDTERLALDPAVREEYKSDPLIYHGGVRIRMGMHFMDMEKYLKGVPARIKVPLLILHSKEDRLASIEGSRMLYREAASSDKRLIEVENSGHEVLRDYPHKEICDLICRWLTERA